MIIISATVATLLYIQRSNNRTLYIVYDYILPIDIIFLLFKRSNITIIRKALLYIFYGEVDDCEKQP